MQRQTARFVIATMVGFFTSFTLSLLLDLWLYAHERAHVSCGYICIDVFSSAIAHFFVAAILVALYRMVATREKHAGCGAKLGATLGLIWTLPTTSLIFGFHDAMPIFDDPLWFLDNHMHPLLTVPSFALSGAAVAVIFQYKKRDRDHSTFVSRN